MQDHKQSGHGCRRGLTCTETVFAVVSAAIVLAILTTSLGFARGLDKEAVSARNLRQMGIMHVMYAGDWNGRQWTVTPDDLTMIIGGQGSSYPSGYGGYPEVPPVILGRTCGNTLVQTFQGWAIQPMWFSSNCSLGSFRAFNTRPFNQYANNRVYDPLFWAPRDPRYEALQDYFNDPCEWPSGGPISFHFSTYCVSLAAQVDPAVYRGPQDGGSQRAKDLRLGHRTPSLAMARYPDLKTHMLEHLWLNPPPYTPFIPGTGGVPWHFNMSPLSEPITLFFDGSVRKLPVMEVLVSNDIVRRGGADRLWANDPACFGTSGYFESYTYIPDDIHERLHSLIDQRTSYHVFTRDGILGRDTIFTR